MEGAALAKAIAVTTTAGTGIEADPWTVTTKPLSTQDVLTILENSYK
ncbi:MAG: hypothetical protein RR448_04850 [Niameybacter sp.]